MANRIKVICKKGSVQDIGGEVRREHILQAVDKENIHITLDGEYEVDFEIGREYYVDFCKVIAPRSGKEAAVAEDGQEGRPNFLKRIKNDPGF